MIKCDYLTSGFPTRLRGFMVVVLSLLAIGPLCAAPAEGPQSAPSEAAKSKTLLDLFNSGGVLMYPLLLCSMGTVGVASYCFLRIRMRKMMPAEHVVGIGQLVERHDPGGAYALCLESQSAFANTVAAALLKVNFDRDLANKASMEQAAAETLGDEETRLMLWVNYLNVFATIGPMLGLLGTVTGMIESFDALAAGKSEPADLAGGIGEAMTTTAGGLFVGIPAMFLYFYFRNLLTMAVAAIQKKVTFLIDVVSGELRLEAATTDHLAPSEVSAASGVAAEHAL